MHATFKFITLTVIAAITTSVHSAAILRTPRQAPACGADSSLAHVIYQGYNSVGAKHSLNFRYDFVAANTAIGNRNASIWDIQGPAFKAWHTQQTLTVPLFRLGSNAPGDDYVYAVGTNAQTPPTVIGFNGPQLIAWVYNTSACGGVALMSAFNTAQNDHYWTTDPDEHAGLLATGNGWTEAGVVAYVLPLAAL